MEIHKNSKLREQEKILYSERQYTEIKPLFEKQCDIVEWTR